MIEVIRDMVPFLVINVWFLMAIAIGYMCLHCGSHTADKFSRDSSARSYGLFAYDKFQELFSTFGMCVCVCVCVYVGVWVCVCVCVCCSYVRTYILCSRTHAHTGSLLVVMFDPNTEFMSGCLSKNDTATMTMAQLLFYLQIVICPLIALNALIAIMGAQFSKVLSIVHYIVNTPGH